VPKLTRVAVLADASSLANALLIGQTETAVQTLGVAHAAAPATVAEPKSNSFSSYLGFLIPAAAGEDGARGVVRPEIVDAVDRQQIGKPRARAVDPALDRPDRAAADRRGAIY
jgi:hypothetical protein